MKSKKLAVISLIMVLFMATAFSFGISSPNNYAGALDYNVTTEFAIATKEDFFSVLENNRDKDFADKTIVFTTGLDISEKLITPYNNFIGTIKVEVITNAQGTTSNETGFVTRGMDKLDGMFLFPKAKFSEGHKITLKHSENIIYINTQYDFEKVFVGEIASDKTIILNTDIYLSDAFSGLTSFAGTFLGQNHKIIGLGTFFFGSIKETARIRDVSFLDTFTTEHDTILPYITSKADTVAGTSSTETFVFSNVVVFGKAKGIIQFYKNDGTKPYESQNSGFATVSEKVDTVKTIEDILQNYVNNELNAELGNSINFLNLKLDKNITLNNSQKYLIFNDNKNIVSYTYLGVSTTEIEAIADETLQLTGLGTKKEPYNIANAKDLIAFLKLEKHQGKFGRLIDNIHLDGANTSEFVLKNNLLGNGYSISGGYGRLFAEISVGTSISNLTVGYSGVAATPSLIGINNGTIDNLNIYGGTEDVTDSAIIGTNNWLILGLENHVSTKYMILENIGTATSLSNISIESTLVKNKKNQGYINTSTSYKYEDISNLTTCIQNGETIKFLGNNNSIEDVMKSFYIKSGVMEDIYYINNIKNYDTAKENSNIYLPSIGDIVFEAVRKKTLNEGEATTISSSTISIAILKENYFDRIDFFNDKTLTLKLFSIDGDIRREVTGEINEIGRYALTVAMPSGLTYTEIQKEYSFQIVLGTVAFVPNPILDDLVYNGYNRDEYVQKTIKDSIYFNIFGEGAIDTENFNLLFDGWAFSYTVTWDGGTANSIKNAGRYSIEISATKYGMADQILHTEITITKASISLSPSALNINYGQALAASFVVDGGLLGNDTVDSAIKASNIIFDTNYIAFSSAPGKYRVRLKEKEIGLSSTNYNVSLDEEKYASFDVIKLTIIADELQDNTVDYNGIEQGIIPYTKEYLDGLSAKYHQTVTVSYSFDNKIVDCGVYIIIIKLSAPNYVEQSYSKTLIINQIAAKYVADDKTVNYLDAAPTFSGKLQGILDVDIDKPLIKGNLVFNCDYKRDSNAGEYDIMPSGITATNYIISFEKAMLTVKKIHTSCRLFNPSKSYDGTPYIPSLTLDDVSIEYWKAEDPSIRYTEIKNAGQYIMEVTKSETTNYLAFKQTFSTEILSIDLNVAYEDNYNTKYNGKFVDISFGELPSNYHLDIVYNITKNSLPTDLLITNIKDVGIYAIEVTITDSLGNYNNKNLATTLIISAINLDIADIPSVIFNGEIIIPEITTKTEIAQGDSLTFGYKEKDGLEIKNAKTYNLEITLSNDNYIIKYAHKQFSILPFVVIINLASIAPFEIMYGEALEIQYTHTFLLNNKEIKENLTGIGNISNPSVNSYDLVDFRPNSDTKNYIFEVRNGANKFKVVPREVDFKLIGASSAPYKGDFYKNIYQATDITNVINGDILEIIFEPELPLIGAAVYNIDAKSANKNYILKQSRFSFEITKKNVSLAVNDIEITYNDSLPSRYDITIDGLLGGDTVAVFSNLVFSSDYTKGANVGNNYYLEVEGGLATNYLITERTRGVLTVKPKEIDWVTVSDTQYVYDGSPKGVKITGDTTNMIISDSLRPSDVGIYNVDVTFVLANHNKKIVTAKLKIDKASPTLIVDSLNLKYNADIVLDAKLIKGSAIFKDKEIEGSFSFLSSDLRFGRNQYTVSFVPKDSLNLNTVYAEMVIEASVAKEDFVLTFDDSVKLEEGNVINHNDDIVMIFRHNLGQNANIRYFLNGIEINNAYYIFKETMLDALLQYKIGEEIIYQNVLQIYIDRTVTPPVDPTPTPPIITEPPNLTWLYITLGVVAIIVIVGVVIILNNKK